MKINNIYIQNLSYNHNKMRKQINVHRTRNGKGGISSMSYVENALTVNKAQLSTDLLQRKQKQSMKSTALTYGRTASQEGLKHQESFHMRNTPIKKITVSSQNQRKWKQIEEQETDPSVRSSIKKTNDVVNSPMTGLTLHQLHGSVQALQYSQLSNLTNIEVITKRTQPDKSATNVRQTKEDLEQYVEQVDASTQVLTHYSLESAGNQTQQEPTVRSIYLPFSRLKSNKNGQGGTRLNATDRDRHSVSQLRSKQKRLAGERASSVLDERDDGGHDSKQHLTDLIHIRQMRSRSNQRSDQKKPNKSLCVSGVAKLDKLKPKSPVKPEYFSGVLKGLEQSTKSPPQSQQTKARVHLSAQRRAFKSARRAKGPMLANSQSQNINLFRAEPKDNLGLDDEVRRSQQNLRSLWDGSSIPRTKETSIRSRTASYDIRYLFTENDDSLENMKAVLAQKKIKKLLEAKLKAQQKSKIIPIPQAQGNAQITENNSPQIDQHGGKGKSSVSRPRSKMKLAAVSSKQQPSINNYKIGKTNIRPRNDQQDKNVDSKMAQKQQQISFMKPGQPTVNSRQQPRTKNASLAKMKTAKLDSEILNHFPKTEVQLFHKSPTATYPSNRIPTKTKGGGNRNLTSAVIAGSLGTSSFHDDKNDSCFTKGQTSNLNESQLEFRKNFKGGFKAILEKMDKQDSSSSNSDLLKSVFTAAKHLLGSQKGKLSLKDKLELIFGKAAVDATYQAIADDLSVDNDQDKPMLKDFLKATKYNSQNEIERANLSLKLIEHETRQTFEDYRLMQIFNKTHDTLQHERKVNEYYAKVEDKLLKKFVHSTESLKNLGYVLKKRVLAKHGSQSQKVYITQRKGGQETAMDRVLGQTIEIIGEYPSYFNVDIDQGQIKRDPSIKWPLIFRLSLKEGQQPVALEVYISTRYVVPTPTKCEKSLTIEVLPNKKSTFYFGTAQDLQILKLKYEQEALEKLRQSKQKQSQKHEVDDEQEKISFCIRRKPARGMPNEGHELLGVEAIFTQKVTFSQIHEQGEEQRFQESLNEMGLAWLTPTKRASMPQHEIEELILKQDQYVNEDLWRYWNANQPLQSSWCRENYIEEQKQRKNDPELVREPVHDQFFLQRNIQATHSYKGPTSLKEKRQQNNLERSSKLYINTKGPLVAEEELIQDYGTKARQKRITIDQQRRDYLSSDADRWQTYRRDKSELVENLLVVMKSKKRIQMLKTLVILKRLLNTLSTNLETLQTRLIVRIWRISLAHQAQIFFRNVHCRHYNPDFKIRLNKIVIRSFTFWTSNIFKDYQEAQALRCLSSFLPDVHLAYQVTQNVKHLQSRVIFVQRARRAFAKHQKTRTLQLKVMLYKHLNYLTEFYQKKAEKSAQSKKKGAKDKLIQKIFTNLCTFLHLYTEALSKDQSGICTFVPEVSTNEKFPGQTRQELGGTSVRQREPEQQLLTGNDNFDEEEMQQNEHDDYGSDKSVYLNEYDDVSQVSETQLYHKPMHKMLARQKSKSSAKTHTSSLGEDLERIRLEEVGMDSGSDGENGPGHDQAKPLTRQGTSQSRRDQQVEEVNQRVNEALDLMRRHKLDAYLLEFSLDRFIAQSSTVLALSYRATNTELSPAEVATLGRLNKSRMQLAKALPVWKRELEEQKEILYGDSEQIVKDDTCRTRGVSSDDCTKLGLKQKQVDANKTTKPGEGKQVADLVFDLINTDSTPKLPNNFYEDTSADVRAFDSGHLDAVIKEQMAALHLARGVIGSSKSYQFRATALEMHRIIYSLAMTTNLKEPKSAKKQKGA